MIGKLPPGVKTAHVNQLLAEVPILLEDADPVQNCVNWMRQAVVALQRQEWAEGFDVDVFMDDALAQADKWLVEKGGSKVTRINYTSRKF